MENKNNMTDKPIKVDDVDETTVYVASLELRSVGTREQIFPQLKWSHIFTEEPSTVPHAYQAALAIANKIGAVVYEEDLEEDVVEDIGEGEEAIKALSDLMQQIREGGDDTVH